MKYELRKGMDSIIVTHEDEGVVFESNPDLTEWCDNFLTNAVNALNERDRIRAQVEKLRDEAMAKHIQLTDEEGTAPGVDVSRSFRQHGMRIAFQTVLDLLDGES